MKITARKFRDSNGNGTWDAGEQPISNWEIHLYNAGTTDHWLDSPGFTDASGNVVFTVDKDGAKYDVVEIIPGAQGWVATTPVSVEVTANGDQTVTFGNWKPIDITVYKFRDSNGNGNWDGGEHPLANWTFEIFLAGTTTYGRAEQDSKGTTDSSGKIVFVVDNDGRQYDVVETLPDASWEATTPGGVKQTLTANGNQTLFFGNWQPMEITARKFRDSNGNGTWDAGEQPISNWEIHLYKAGTTDHWLDSPGFTDASGNVVFTVDKDGAKVRRGRDHSGWPRLGCHDAGEC
jgi:hypothetical protein